MTWNTPRTWTDGEVVKARLFNEQIRDDLLVQETALATTAGSVFVGDGANSLVERTGTSGDALVSDGTTADWSKPWALARKVYNPGTPDTWASTSGWVAVQWTAYANSSVTFTVPTSGAVRVRCEAVVSEGNSTSDQLSWGVVTDTGNPTGTRVTGSESRVRVGRNGTNYRLRLTHEFVITGLTPASSLTWYWSQQSAGTNFTVYAGGVYGPAIMEVSAA